jgi:hypothetical protein
MKKKDFITSEEIAALIERAEARSLKEGDGQIIAEVIRKILMIEQLVKEDKIPGCTPDITSGFRENDGL